MARLHATDSQLGGGGPKLRVHGRGPFEHRSIHIACTPSARPRDLTGKTDWYATVPKDHDGVPIVAPDDTPHDGLNRPKRKEPKYFENSTRILQKFNSLAALRSINPRGGAFASHQPALPKVPGIVPEPRNGMTVERFLKKIGRDCVKHLSLFKSWEALFSARGTDFKRLQVPLRDRKYIMAWLERYRQGLEPRLLTISRKSKKNASLEWRQKLITQKDKRIELGLE